jgi:hypothetical protein
MEGEQTIPGLARFSVDASIALIQPPLIEAQLLRAKYALTVINIALDELAYAGPLLPDIYFSPNMVINDVPRASVFTTDFAEAPGTPLILIDIGDTIAEKSFTPEAITSMRNNGLSSGQIRRVAMFDVICEEIYHFVDYTKGKLPPNTGPQGMLEGYDNYYDQPHEKRAQTFVSEAVAKFYGLIISKSEF